MERNGFTLVELMVVIFLMALAAAAVVLASGPSDGPRDEASRFASRVAAARDTAIVTARPVRLWVRQSGFGFEEYRANAWQPASAPPLASRDWNDGTGVVLAQSRDGQGAVQFDSLGMPDAENVVTLTRAGLSANVRIAANGDVQVQ